MKIKKSTDKAEMDTLLVQAHSLIDKAAKKGVIHRNNADRKKSRLSKFVKNFEAN